MAEMQMKTLEDLFRHEMRDLLSAEQMVRDETRMLSNVASDEELKKKLFDLSQAADGQMGKLRQAFTNLGLEPESETCKGMGGIVDQANQVMQEITQPNVKDAAIIAEVQKIKHYEISSYGTLRAYAGMLGHDDVANMADDVIEGESNMDEELTDMAMETINPRAME